MPFKELRARAEDAVGLTRHDVAMLANQDVQRLVHELQVHQIELEMQNESLRTTQRTLEESQERYQELFDWAPAGYLMLDPTFAVVRANAAALTLLGVAKSRIIGQQLAAFVSPQDCLRLHEHLRDAHWKGGPASCELRLKTLSDTPLHVRLDTRPIAGDDPGMLIVLTDVSERQRAREQLERLNAELEARAGARTAELEMRNRQLEAESLARERSEAQQRELENRLRDAKRLDSIGLLAGGIAHDFNNLLVSVVGNAELMLHTPGLPESFRGPLLSMKRATDEATELTNQLLTFAGRGKLAISAVSLPHLVADSLEVIQKRIPANIQLQAQITNDLPLIEADRGQVHQVVMNLVTNAIEAIPGEGSIAVRTQLQALDENALAQYQHHSQAKPGRFVLLQVQDSGPGIEPAVLTQIFDPFFTTKFIGRGLGLASALGIVQSHGGALRVRTRPSAGASFEVAFPVAEALPKPDRLREPDSDWTGTGNVLLIDDDDAVREVMMRLLQLLGFTVVAANSGAKGLELLRRANPAFDLVVVDWIMPGYSGEQVLKTMREFAPELPAILMSGYSTDELASNVRRVVRVQKPMTLAHLRDAVRKVTGSEEAVPVVAKRERRITGTG